MTERELKPCPFCGKQPYVAEEIDPDDWWYVTCQTPGCILPCAGGHTSIESAIAKWDSRTTPDRDSIIEECAALADSMAAGGYPATVIGRDIRALKTASNGEQS
ncbi:TPA: Lar family restriction alleviation protein [Burkholderia cepacia]|nr:Lar family restriction alleviation protein [Burkholderia cepacia]